MHFVFVLSLHRSQQYGLELWELGEVQAPPLHMTSSTYTTPILVRGKFETSNTNRMLIHL